MAAVCRYLPSIKYVNMQLLFAGVRQKLVKEPYSVISPESPILDNIPAVAIPMWEHAGRRGCLKGIKAQKVKRMRCKQDDDQEDQRG